MGELKDEVRYQQYHPRGGFALEWKTDGSLSVVLSGEKVRISGNRSGLRNLATALLNLSQNSVTKDLLIELKPARHTSSESIILELERKETALELSPLPPDE